MIASVALSLLDAVTDSVFVYYVSGLANSSLEALETPLLVFLLAPLVFNAITVWYVVGAIEMRRPEFSKFFDAHRGPVSIVMVLSLVTTDNMNLLQSAVFGLKIFQAPLTSSSRRIMRMGGLPNLVVRKIPVLIIQAYVQTAVGKAILTTIISIVVSSASVLVGIFKMSATCLWLQWNPRASVAAPQSSSAEGGGEGDGGALKNVQLQKVVDSPMAESPPSPPKPDSPAHKVDSP